MRRIHNLVETIPVKMKMRRNLVFYKDADKPCPFCGQMHLPVTQTVIPKSFGFIIRLTPKWS